MYSRELRPVGKEGGEDGHGCNTPFSLTKFQHIFGLELVVPLRLYRLAIEEGFVGAAGNGGE